MHNYIFTRSRCSDEKSFRSTNGVSIPMHFRRIARPLKSHRYFLLVVSSPCNRRNHHIWNYTAADLYSPFAANFTLHSWPTWRTIHISKFHRHLRVHTRASAYTHLTVTYQKYRPFRKHRICICTVTNAWNIILLCFWHVSNERPYNGALNEAWNVLRCFEENVTELNRHSHYWNC